MRVAALDGTQVVELQVLLDALDRGELREERGREGHRTVERVLRLNWVGDRTPLVVIIRNMRPEY
jgi:hypothetical protein